MSLPMEPAIEISFGDVDLIFYRRNQFTLLNIFATVIGAHDLDEDITEQALFFDGDLRPYGNLSACIYINIDARGSWSEG